jgi:hypothetical protein
MPRLKGSKNKPKVEVLAASGKANGTVVGRESDPTHTAPVNLEPKPLIIEDESKESETVVGHEIPITFTQHVETHAVEVEAGVAHVHKWPHEYLEAPTPMRKLWELVKRLGAQVKDPFNRREIETALEDAGYVQEPPKLENIEDYWTFESRTVGKDFVQAFDIAGDYSAKVYPDGHCELTKHTPPNRISRIPGIRYADEIIKINHLESFAASLYMLLNESDQIFDESVESWNAKNAAIQVAEPVSGPTVHGHDPRIDQMLLIADEFALSGVHRPSTHDLPRKLAEALEIKLKTSEGVDKEWTDLADEVIAKADLNMQTAGGKYGS